MCFGTNQIQSWNFLKKTETLTKKFRPIWLCTKRKKLIDNVLILKLWKKYFGAIEDCVK